MGTPSKGNLSKLGIAATGTGLGAYSNFFEFNSESLKADRLLQDLSGIRGTRSRPKERCRFGNIEIGGSIEFNPTPSELDYLLPMILGADEATDVFAVAETLPERDITIDRVAKVFTYGECKCNKGTFSASSGEQLKLVMDFFGKTETIGNAGSFTYSTPSLTTPYMMADGVLTIGGTTYPFNDFSLSVDNKIERRFSNSQTAVALVETDREVMLTVNVPWTPDETALYDMALAGAAATLVFTNGNASLTFSLANIKPSPGTSPTVNARNEIMLGLTFKAYMSSTTKEIVVTNDSTF